MHGPYRIATVACESGREFIDRLHVPRLVRDGQAAARVNAVLVHGCIETRNSTVPTRLESRYRVGGQSNLSDLVGPHVGVGVNNEFWSHFFPFRKRRES